MKLNIYILLFLVIVIISFMFLLNKNREIKEGYETPTITYSGKCNNGEELKLYKNDGLNRWYDTLDFKDVLNKIKTTSFTDEVKCMKVLPLKRYHNNSSEPNIQTINKVPFDNTNLSTDNIRLMDACDFYTGYNPITGSKCIETFINNLEDKENGETVKNSMERELSFDDKMYLTICSALLVVLLFKASDKFNI
jgi:hypothetical protein